VHEVVKLFAIDPDTVVEAPCLVRRRSMPAHRVPGEGSAAEPIDLRTAAELAMGTPDAEAA
jgi:hypothetical protein